MCQVLVSQLHRPGMSGACLLRRSRANPSACLAHNPERHTPRTHGRDLVLIRRAPFLALWSLPRCNRGWWVGHKRRLAPALGLEIPRLSPTGFSFRIPAWLEHARILPLQLWITYPVLRTGPMVPASDFGPVGEGVTFLPGGNARGHVPGPGGRYSFCY